MSVKREKWPWKATATVSVGAVTVLGDDQAGLAGASIRPSVPATPTASPDAAGT